MYYPLHLLESPDQLISTLYGQSKQYNWNQIARQVNSRFLLSLTPDQCRNRYVEKHGIVTRDQWTRQEEMELYRLHNQNGNKWAIISQSLLGRNDNAVKNHFYSKLRKSLRTINKVGKLYFKKQIKQVSELVLYKLTEVTDESLKSDCNLPKDVVRLGTQIKRKLLEYEKDQKLIESCQNVEQERQLIIQLNEFNRVYKKKAKKEKPSFFTSDNSEKRKNSVNSQGRVNEQIQYSEGASFSTENKKQETANLRSYNSLFSIQSLKNLFHPTDTAESQNCLSNIKLASTLVIQAPPAEKVLRGPIQIKFDLGYVEAQKGQAQKDERIQRKNQGASAKPGNQEIQGTIFRPSAFSPFKFYSQQKLKMSSKQIGEPKSSFRNQDVSYEKRDKISNYKP